MQISHKAVISETPVFFKTDTEYEQWLQLPVHNKPMYKLAFEYCTIHYKMFAKAAVITSIYRPKTDDSGVHALWRAVDFRTHHLDLGEKKWLERYFKQHYVYDDDRPDITVLLIHGKDLNEHAHLQIHPHTYRKRFYYK